MAGCWSLVLGTVAVLCAYQQAGAACSGEGRLSCYDPGPDGSGCEPGERVAPLALAIAQASGPYYMLCIGARNTKLRRLNLIANKLETYAQAAAGTPTP